MAQYRFDPIWNTYFLEEAENFSLVDGQDHTDPNAGVTDRIEGASAPCGGR